MRIPFTLFQLQGLLFIDFPSEETRNGPCSVNKPSMELHPGPPFNHRTSGSDVGSRCDSTNLKDTTNKNMINVILGDEIKPIVQFLCSGGLQIS